MYRRQEEGAEFAKIAQAERIEFRQYSCVVSLLVAAREHSGGNVTDRVARETRTRIMRSNRAFDTGLELEVRHALHSCGFRYRLGGCGLPGKPDLILPKHRAVVFVHGCYWHGHECTRRPQSKSNLEYWKPKIERNRKRDDQTVESLLELGWRVLTVWECAIRRREPPFCESGVLQQVAVWLRGDSRLGNLSEKGFEELL